MLNLLAIPTYFAISGVNIAIIDVVALVILLIFIIVGLVKGFAQQVLSILGWVAAALVAFFTCKTLAEYVCDTFPVVVETVNGWWSGLLGEEFASVTSPEGLKLALESSNIPVFLHQTIIDAVGTEASNIVTTVSTTLTNWCLIAVSFIAIFLVAFLLFAIIKKIFSALTSIPAVKSVDKFLGFLLGVIKGLVFLLIVALILSLIPGFNTWLAPVTESGETVTCYFSIIYEYIFSLPFVKDALSKIHL